MGVSLSRPKSTNLTQIFFRFFSQVRYMENDKDIIIKELMGEILRLKTELTEVKDERDAIKKQFDELKVILRET